MAENLVFLTGGTGFLGRHLVPALLERNYAIRLLARGSSDLSWLPKGDIEIFRGDVTDRKRMKTGLEGCDYVIHAAANFRFWGSEELFTKVNIGGTKNVVEAAIQKRVKRFIHISTVVVVGEPPLNGMIDENTPCVPQDDYQKSKFASEQYVQEMARAGALPAVILRPGAFYGPGSTYGFNRLFIVEPMRYWRIKLNRGRLVTFPAYLPDVAGGICAAITSGEVGEVYILSGKSHSHQEINDRVSQILEISKWRMNLPQWSLIVLAAFLEFVARITGKEPFYPLNLRHYVFKDWVVSSDKAVKKLGFNSTPIEEGLESTIEWLKEKNGRD